VLTAGGNATIELSRTQKAERLYRLTGFGVFYDSVLLGAAVPTSRPMLNGGVLGQDSILSVVFANKVRWFWGDTNHMSYPLGNFETSGATSCAPAGSAGSSGSGGAPPDATGLEACMSPEVGIDLTYFTVPDASTGGVFTKKMAAFDMNLGSFPTWIGSVSVVPDTGPNSVDGFAMTMLYQKPNHDFTTLAIGAAIWDEQVRVPIEPLCMQLPRHGDPIRVHLRHCCQAQLVVDVMGVWVNGGV
jgi:hypothetical protein